MLVQVAQGTVPMIFKPTIDLYTEKTDVNPVVPQGEPIQVSITLRNPLKISIALRDVELLWQFAPSQEDPSVKEPVVNNEPAVATGSALESNVICGQKIKTVLLDGDSKKILTFSLTPLRVGQLFVQGCAYKLINMGESGTESGNGNISGKVDLLSGVNDKRLQITVIPHAPCLQMTFSETNPEVLSGELRTIDVEFRNVGPVDMQSVYIAVSHPDCISLVTGTDEDDFKQLYDDKFKEPVVYPAVSHPDCISLVTGTDEDDFKQLYDDKFKEPVVYPAVSHPDCISLVTGTDEDDFKQLYDDKFKEPVVYPAVSHPDCVSLVTGTDEDDFKQLYDDKFKEPVVYPDERAARTAAWKATAVRHVSRAATGVPRGGFVRARLQLRPRVHAPALCLLAYYETGAPRRPHRLLRHVFRFNVTVSIPTRH
ncbi:trafficking protein particle complex subunit 8 [Phthorimaea operculella]|nr:trafficking protein particle complex subunit 8 [Phthorimaea operculella]